MAGSCDMFLAVKGSRTGVIKGEAEDAGHAGDIEIVSWTWGMQARPTLGGGTASGKATIRELQVVKRIDSSSTALMAALRNNELIAKAVLTQRKAGKTPLEFLKITIEQGRVTSLVLEAGDSEHGPTVVERVSFSFNKIDVEYKAQRKDGQLGGGFLFSDEFGAAS
jgi:type VI secretion system secreted protein Hcp